VTGFAPKKVVGVCSWCSCSGVKSEAWGAVSTCRIDILANLVGSIEVADNEISLSQVLEVFMRLKWRIVACRLLPSKKCSEVHPAS
jgi:hypothetical protein